MSRKFAVVAALATVGAVVAMLLPTKLVSAESVVGSQGTDTSLPATDSQVTVNGRGTFADLSITVNQTAELNNQSVSITWTGGRPTIKGPGRFGGNFLQIFQCWGDPDGTNPENPGPPPEQCVQGGFNGKFGGLPTSSYPADNAITRVISTQGWDNYEASKSAGVLEARTKWLWRPFRSVGGTTVDYQTDSAYNPSFEGKSYWKNPYFDFTTTNEIPGAVTSPDGKGAELFQVVTGKQMPGLGCGQKAQPDAAGGKVVPQCWIVVVPRGTALEENAGTPYGNPADADAWGVVTSPVAPAAWQNRIAIPISFNPVDSPCTIGAEETRISGNELALPAVARWQPALCASSDLPPYSYAPVADATARQQLTSSALGSAGMIVVSQPLAPTASTPQKPIIYAPVSASGIVIGFNVERSPHHEAPTDEFKIAGVRVADIKLTPRLVAKLLTQSYKQAVLIGSGDPKYPWMQGNPMSMGTDEDFLRFNPEFRLLSPDARGFSSLQLSTGVSDAAQQVWSWVLADPEAKAWLAGAPDEWGMRVNPYYSTDATVNPTGIAFGDPAPNSFPKSDPYCYQAPAIGANADIVPPALCATDWVPYTRSFYDSALITRNASDGAKIVGNPFAIDASHAWSKQDPQYLGQRAMLAVTDTPSAAQFGLQTAQLSRAGDDGETRRFIAADSAGLQAGVFSMAPKTDPSFLEPDPLADAPDAYPLTTMTYAAIAPLKLSQEARDNYATFLEYAAGPGQTSGYAYGELPKGYVPLLDPLRQQTLNAADAVRTVVAAPEETTTTEATTTTVATTSTTVAATTSTVGQTTTQTTEAETVTTTRSSANAGSGGGSRGSGTGSGGQSSATTQPVSTTAAPVVTESSAATDAPVPETSAPETTDTPETTQAVTTTAAPAPSTTLQVSTTPIVDLAKSRYTVPTLGAVALGSAWGAMEISRRPRRRARKAAAGGGLIAGPGPRDDLL